MRQELYFKLIEKYPFLSTIFKLNNGFIREEQEDERDYIFGASNCKKEVLQESGQWTQLVPEVESQNEGTESMACVSYSLLNVVEILNKRKWEEDKNYSDRFLAKVSGTTKYGNSIGKVVEALRKHKGVVRQEYWDVVWDSWARFYQNIPGDVLKNAKLWLKEYELQYERVPDYKQTIMEALKYSPLWTSGFAWYPKNGLYRNYGRANHAFVIIGYVEGSHWLVFDSYSPFIKKLEWDYKFSGTKVIMLGKKSLAYNTEKIQNLMNKGYTHILRAENNGEVYKLNKDGLTKVEPEQLIKDGVKVLADYKKLVGVTEDLYNSLIK